MDGWQVVLLVLAGVFVGLWIPVSLQLSATLRSGKKLRLKEGFDPRRNCPWNIRLSAEKIAELRGVAVSSVIDRTSDNAAAVFGIRA